MRNGDCDCCRRWRVDRCRLVVHALFGSSQKREQAALAAAELELDDCRSQLGAAREALARIEARRDAELQAASDKLALLEETKANLEESFKALSADALSKNNASFLNLARTTLEKYQEGAKGDLDKRQQAINKTVEPVGEALKLFNQRVNQIEARRTETDASLRQQLRQLADSQLRLSETPPISSARCASPRAVDVGAKCNCAAPWSSRA